MAPESSLSGLWVMAGVGLACLGVLVPLILWAVRRVHRHLPLGPGALRFMGLFAQSTQIFVE